MTRLKKNKIKKGLADDCTLPVWVKNQITNAIKNEKNNEVILNLNGKSVENEIDKIVDNQIIELQKCLGPLGSRLKELDVSNNMIGDKGIEYLANWLNKNINLKTINLIGNKEISDESIPNLTKMIQKSAIEDICIQSTSITKPNALVITLALNCLKCNAEKMTFRNRGVTLEDIVQICNGFKRYLPNKLRDINFGENDLSLDAIFLLIETMIFCGIKLTKLDLSGNRIDDSCIKSLGTYLNFAQHVEYLNIEDNYMTSKGIKELSQYIFGNQKLKTLKIDENPNIKDDSIETLVEIINRSAISKLTFVKTGISSSKSIEIVRALENPINKRKIHDNSASKTSDFDSTRSQASSNSPNKTTTSKIKSNNNEDQKKMPLKTINGKEPRVGIVLIVYGSEWRLKTLNSSSSGLSFGDLSKRMKLVENIFVGCSIDRMLNATGIFDSLLQNEDENVRNEFKKWHRFVETERNIIPYLQSQPKYDFILLLNIRIDYRNPGMGYGLPERSEREVTRSCILASNGNMMLGDWGIPKDYGLSDKKNDWSDIELATLYDGSWYESYETERALRKYRYIPDCQNNVNAFPIPQQGFARLIRLRRYLRVISSNEEQLPLEWINKIQNAVQGKEFSEANIWAAWLTGIISLTYVKDLWQNPNYKYQNVRMEMIKVKLAKILYEWLVWYQNEAWEEEMVRVVLIGLRFAKRIILVFIGLITISIFLYCYGIQWIAEIIKESLY